MGHLVAAPDKFRGTAAASEVAAAAAGSARAAGWTADEVPMADGGEGILEAVHGEVHHSTVAGPLGDPVDVEWHMVGPSAAGESPTAVIESALAIGRALLPSPSGDDPVRASTAGVGQLVLAAVDAGARRVVVGVGGSSTSDGGWGAVEAIGAPARLGGAEVVVACDVVTPFRLAAEIFGPQKGATPAQVATLTARLDDLAARYRRDLGVDVDALPGAGAAGGLAGGLAALGARLQPGFDLVSDLVGLPGRLACADLVVTGEGRLDPPSVEGKVVGGVMALVGGRAPVLCVVGHADPAAAARASAANGVEVVSLTGRAGPELARREVAALVAEVVAARLAAWPTGG
ncbi:MAG: glycerate kinase [Acidimicrobiales bacterium]